MSNKKNKFYKPDWVPENASKAFATKVVEGVEKGDGTNNTVSTVNPYLELKKRKKLSIQNYIDGVLKKDRTILARAITLIESNSQKQREIISDEWINNIKKQLPNCSKISAHLDLSLEK